jgi:asparagine synthase (glutamine-hydrolysing)
MCGITGIFGISDVNQAQKKVESMNNALKHRGPNADGVFVNENVALGHRRLSIIDLSDAGTQPFYTHDRRQCIVFNGEIYNFQSVKDQLVAHYPFTTGTDTEVILAAYRHWGKDCLHKFNGMFAFALWDFDAQELWITRDRLGIKPLYYHYHNGVLCFASEVRALLASALVPRKLNRLAVIDYLRHQTVHAPQTMVENVMMLMPGHTITISIKNGLNIQKYWDITENYSTASHTQTYNEVKKNVYDLLLAAVERRLVADVPFGAFLSGGIDSSAIVGLMSQVATKPIETFSITFAEEKYSEAKYARLIAQKFNTNHHDIQLDPNDFLALIPAGLEANDHPSGDGLNTFVVSKVTKEAGVTMALSGLGGDELFAGYPIFARTHALENKYKWLNTIPKPLRKASGSLIKTLKPSSASTKIAELMALDKINFESTYPYARQVLNPQQISALMHHQPLPSSEVAHIIHTQLLNKDAQHKYPLLSKVSFGEICTYMQNVLLRDTDQYSMAHALEVRVPFLDYELVEYVFGIKDAYKYPHTPKKLLVDALGSLLPAEIVNRPKMGFTLPWAVWIKNELNELTEKSIKKLAQRGIMNEQELLNLWQQYTQNHPDVSWSRIWYMVILENWIEKNGIEI